MDIIARLLSLKLAQTLSQAVIVDSRVGASGTIGTLSVAKAKPDGNTVDGRRAEHGCGTTHV